MTIDALDGIDVSYHVFINVFDFNIILIAFSFIPFTVRSLDLFYKIFLIEPEKRKATPLCPFVSSGIMHREFQKYLRPDHLGIDYSFLDDFDTRAELARKNKWEVADPE